LNERPASDNLVTFEAFVERVDAVLRECLPNVSLGHSATPVFAVWQSLEMRGGIRPNESCSVTLSLGSDGKDDFIDPLTVPMSLEAADDIARGDLALFLGDSFQEDD